MRLLVTSINCEPDHSGIAIYATDCARFLVERRHQVTMVTGFPYYPQWRKRPEDHGSLLRDETVRGLRILRGYLYVPDRVTTLRRIVHELTFVLFAFLNFLRAGRHDAIVAFSPPLLLGLLGAIFARVWGVPLIVNVQDLQPDGALSLGMVKPSPLTRVLLVAEGLMYRHATVVATISESMRARILEKGVPPAKVVLVPNWIDVAAAAASGARAGEFRATQSQLAGRLLVGYAGNIGLKQGLDSLLDLADDLRDRADVHVLLVGDGADRPRLVAEAERRALPNLAILPLLPPETYRAFLADIDVSFVAQRPGAGEFCFPSKVLGILAQGKPLLVAADEDSGLFTLVRDGRCGLAVRAGDRESLGMAANLLLDDAGLRARCAENARRLVRKFDRATVLEAFERCIAEQATPTRSRPAVGEMAGAQP